MISIRPNTFLSQVHTVNQYKAPTNANSPKVFLAKFADVGMLADPFAAPDQVKLKALHKALSKLDPEFVANTAVYSRNKALMKHMPAILCAWLAAHAPHLLEPTFKQVINSPKMLHIYEQILHSGVMGKPSLVSMPKRLVRRWLENRNSLRLSNDSEGEPSSTDNIRKMIHPKTITRKAEAMIGICWEKSTYAASA